MFWQDSVRKNSVKTPFNLITWQNYFSEIPTKKPREEILHIIHSVHDKCLKFCETVWKTIVLL